MRLSVDGIEIFAGTGGRPFDPAKPVTVLLHGAGHFIQEDAPEEIAAAIERWWTADVERAPSPEIHAVPGHDEHAPH